MMDGQAGDNAPLRGADPINGELEVGFNSPFETTWHRYEIRGRILLAIFVVAGAGGFLGSGPFSHHSIRRAEGGIAAVDYEPIARMATPTQVTLHLRRDHGAAVPQGHSVPVTLSSIFIEPFGLRRITPMPLQSAASGGNVVLDMLTRDDEGESLVRLSGEPTQMGVLRLTVQSGSDAPVHFTQFVLP